MPTLPYHIHNFLIPTASLDDMELLASSSVAVTPSNLGSSATKPTSFFASAAQGLLAGTALQPGAIGVTVASIAQGAKADTALQPASIGSSVQGFSANLSTLAAITPGAAGTSILPLSTRSDVRDYLDTAPYTLARSTLKILDPAKDTVAIIKESSRAGVFVWRAGDYSSRVAADPAEGVFVASSVIASTSGAWERVGFDGKIDPRWFGVVGDYESDDTAAFQATLNFSAAFGCTIVGETLNVGTTGGLDFPEGVRIRGSGGANLNTWIMTKDKANIRPGFKSLVGGFNIWLKGASSKTYTTDRVTNYQSFTYGLSYLFTSAPDIEGIGIIQDMDVYTAGGVLTTSANDNRASYDVGMVIRSYGAVMRNCRLFGYWGTGKASLVIHSQTSLANTDSDYFRAINCDFTSVTLIGSESGTQGLTGTTWENCGMYNGADHHTPAGGDYTKTSIYIDGENGAAGLRGHKWIGGNLRTRANNSVILGKCDGIDFGFSATETPPLAGVPGADAQGVISVSASTGRVRTNIGSMSSVAGLGLDAIAATGSLISLGGQNQDEIVVSKAGAVTRVQAGSVATNSVVSTSDAILQAATGSVVRGRVNSTTVYTADATRFSASTGAVRLGGTTAAPIIIAVTGTPEGQTTAPVGSLALRLDGGASTTLYVKQTGTGNTGWVAK